MYASFYKQRSDIRHAKEQARYTLCMFSSISRFDISYAKEQARYILRMPGSLGKIRHKACEKTSALHFMCASFYKQRSNMRHGNEQACYILCMPRSVCRVRVRVSLSIWASELANKCVLFHTDNLGLVDVINKKTTKVNKLIVLLRELVLQCLKHNILFRAVHVPGVLNVKADALSRLQVPKFKSLGQGMDHEQTLVPPHLLPESWPL